MILNVYTYAAMFVRGSIFPDDIIRVNVYNRVINMLHCSNSEFEFPSCITKSTFGAKAIV